MAGVPQFSQVLQSQRAAGTLFNTYTTAKTVLNQTELQTFPANYFDVGSKLRVTARGAWSNVVTTPGTITFQCMMGSIVAWTSGAITMNATARTLLPFTLVVDLRVDSIGTSTAAKFLGMGTLTCQHITNAEVATNVPTTAPAVGTGWDSTIANIFDFWVGFSNSQAGNGIQLYDYTLEQLSF